MYILERGGVWCVGIHVLVTDCATERERERERERE